MPHPLRRLILVFLAALGLGASAQHRRALRLPLAPEPGNAPALAQRIVEVALSVDGVKLDYSPQSLQKVDEIVLRFRKDGQTFEHVGETVFLLGCYVGEVLIRNVGGSWQLPDDHARKIGFEMMGVRTTKGGFWNPIGKTIRLLEKGEEESVQYFFQVVRDA
jgi:hypothetical protein